MEEFTLITLGNGPAREFPNLWLAVALRTNVVLARSRVRMAVAAPP